MNYLVLVTMSLSVLVAMVAAKTSSLQARSSVHIHRKSSNVASSIQHDESSHESFRHAHHKHHHRKAAKHHHRKAIKHHASNSSNSSTVSNSSTLSRVSRVSSDNLGQHKGQGTWYNTGLGACGITSTDSDRVVALSKDLFDLYTPSGNPNNNQLCGAKIHVVYNNNTVTVTVLDRCVACEKFDLDLSPTAFKDLADPDVGRIDIDWDFK